MIIDFHMHRYSREVIADPGAWGRSMREKHWLDLHVSSDGSKSNQEWADRDQLLADMDEAGIGKAVMLGCRSLNIIVNHDTVSSHPKGNVSLCVTTTPVNTARIA